MQELDYLIKKFNIDTSKKSPFELQMKRGRLGQLFKELGYKVGAEVGVEQGKFSVSLLDDGLKVYLVDAWQAYKGYRDHVSQEKLDGFLEITKEAVKDYDAHIIRGYSMDVVKQFDDESLDFVYIDANHDFQNVTNDIAEWSKKVRKGGIVAGHDYIRLKGKDGYLNDTVDVVNGWTYAKKIHPWFILRGDHASSWFFVKQ